MKIAIIGNGFDIRHGYKTAFSDFMDYYDKITAGKNILMDYLLRINRTDGWLDFERELLTFFEYFEDFKNSYRIDTRINASEYRYYFSETEFVNKVEKRIFYDELKKYIIRDNSLEFLEIYTGKIMPNSENWKQEFVDYIDNSFAKTKEMLTRYLKTVTFDKSKVLNTSEIDLINNSDKTFVFNYTDTIERYELKKKICYPHGRLNSEIILGIPYSKNVMESKFMNKFKTTQILSIYENEKINNNYTEPIELYFIGFSFGKSDHYYFQELKDWIDNYFQVNYQDLPPIFFNFYYHSQFAKNDYINNLREFLGENTLVRFMTSKNINFIKYD